MKLLAVKKHAGQQYGGEFPYVIHLQAVESVLLRFGIVDEFLRAVAWGHDLLEDTDLTYEDLCLFFGREIADTIADLTDPKGGNRAWRHMQSYPRIRRNVNALVVKLADRTANIESGGSKQSMYRKEYPEFKQFLYAPEEIDDSEMREIVIEMWAHLDSLLITID